MPRRLSCQHCAGPMPSSARRSQFYCSRACQGAARSAKAIAKFWSRVATAGPDDCWEWQGARLRDGYGQAKYYGNAVGTHRIAYELSHGPIADGLLVRHTCDNPPCCNPAHLLLGTPADNAADRTERGRHQSVGQTHCKNGHPLSGDNLYVRPDGRGRRCKACVRTAKRRYEARLKEVG